jgi:hypothetical protein
MTDKKKGQSIARYFDSSPNKKGEFRKKTKLPPQKYLYMNEKKISEVPNILNIYKYEYISKHFQFGTALATSKYHQEIEETTSHCNEMIKTLDMTGDDLRWVGDEIIYQQEWPLQSKALRIAQLNVNGFSFAKDNFKIDMYLQALMSNQVDIATMQEINLNLNVNSVQTKFREALKRYDSRSSVQLGIMRNRDNDRTYMPGGNAVWNSGFYTGRISRRGQDRYGRWAYTSIIGKKNQEIMIISAYNTCKNTGEDGNTIAAQLRRVMHKKGEGPRVLRNAFFQDIQDFIIEEIKNETLIVLAMDANTKATAEELKTLKMKTSLVDAFQVKHPDRKHPRTFHRGSQCLDYIYLSPGIAHGILRVGYAPFYEMGKYDHRMVFVDIQWDLLFKHRADMTQTRSRRLSVKNRRVTKLYMKTLKDLEKKAGIKKGLERVLELMNGTQTEKQRQQCINKIKKYKTVMMQIMTSAEKKATKTKPSIFRWSKALKKNGQHMRYWNNRKKSSEKGDPEGLHVQVPKGYKPAIATTHDEVMEEFYTVQAEWIKTKDNSAILHHKFMMDLLEHIEETRGCSKETAKKYLYHQEASKAGHKKQSKYLKVRKGGLLTELLIPTPHSKEREAHMTISDEETIETILLRRNKRKLCEATISPFCKGPLADTINENGKCEVSRRIVNGTYDISLIDAMDVKNKKEIKMIMQELVRKRDKDGKPVKDVDVSITKDDYQNMFKRKRETTSCGPTGIIMPHWKMNAEDDDLSTIQAKLMEAPFRYGFTYSEWEVSVHCMLMKDNLPYYHRLRIIQLFEGDLNGALQLLFGKRQMSYMDQHDLNSDATYGGRKGKGCHQALNRIQYTTLYSRTMRQPMGLVDVDASGCFDRMVGRLLSLINQCNGMSQESASCQAEVLHNMLHFVKTTRGVSENYIKRDENTLLEGNGQGNSASVPGWHGHNELLCRVYKRLIHGSRIMSPDRRVNFEQWLSSFIDDNKMLLSFKSNEKYEKMIDKCQESLQIWETLLNVTGGAVELTKCSITILQYDGTTNYNWYNKRPGVPCLKLNNSNNKKCVITREGEQGVVIRQQDIHVGVRLLGIKAAANGTYAHEYVTRLDKSREIAGRLTVSPLDISMSWQAYYCRWKPAITYCLPITTFTAKECQRIQSPFFNALLPKIGVNRNMPRDLLHGPPQVAGLGIINLEAEQLALHVAGLVAQIRKKDRVGQTMLASIDALQIYMGLADHFFTVQAHNYEYRPKRKESQLVYIWEELTMLGCSMECNEFWVPAKRGVNDEAIMDGIARTKQERKGTTQHLPKKALWYANACRLYLKITMLHDICSPCGKYIQEWALDGHRQNATDIIYPTQEKPPPHVWKVWRECILATYQKKSDLWRPTLHRPLLFEDRDDERSWRELIQLGMKIEDALLLLPDYLKEAIGSVICPIDNGKQLSDEMQSFSTTSWTDGTVKDKIGAHAYTIRTIDNRDEVSIRGKCGTPGDSATMTSLRAEHFGVLAVVTLLDIVTLIHDHDKQGKNDHYTDSKAVIMRLQEQAVYTDKQYDCTDYDVWQTTVEAINIAEKVEINLHHVKGHQRETMHEIKNEQGPLTRYAYYNDWCDKECEKERETQHLSTQTCFMAPAKIYLRTSTTLITASAYKAIYEKKTHPAATIYVREKLGLTGQEMDSINWEAMGHYIDNLAISQRVKVMKLIYDWQNVGMQKQLHQWADEEEYLCPYNCGHIEDHMHYASCKAGIDKMSIMCLEAINKWMIRVRTKNKIRTELMNIFYNELPVQRPGLREVYNEFDSYIIAKEQQERIGWKLTMKGIISKEWGRIQEEEYNKIREREGLEIWYTGMWWTKHLIKHVIFWTLNEWQKRNEQLHREIEKRTLSKKRRECQQEIIQLYEQQDTDPARKLKRYFKTPLIERLQQNPARQKQWIESIRALQDKSAIQNRKNRP